MNPIQFWLLDKVVFLLILYFFYRITMIGARNTIAWAIQYAMASFGQQTGKMGIKQAIGWGAMQIFPGVKDGIIYNINKKMGYDPSKGTK